MIESVQVTAMPLGFNRNFQGLMATVPGASNRTASTRSSSTRRTACHGSQRAVRLANNVQIEGVDNNQRTGLLTILIPPAESIDQVSISTSNYDAEFGRAAGAVTSVTLKSGTNNFRGSAFWFFNNESTNATPASAYFSTNKTKPDTSYNQFGFTIGGPIRKNKLFFFGDYQYTKDILGLRAALRRADRGVPPRRSSARRRRSVYDPATGDASGNGPHAVPGQPDPGEPHQPDRPPVDAEDAAAEPPGRGARPGQLPGRTRSARRKARAST